MEDLMRQGDHSKDAARLASDASRAKRTRRPLWRGGLVETLATLRFRDPRSYDEWLDERDTVMIAAVLSRLSDRQLGRIGLARKTLVLGIEDLKKLADRNSQIAREALEIVEEAPQGERHEAAKSHQMAAE